MNSELRTAIKLVLAQFLKETHDIQMKYTPDKLGSDAYRAEQVVCLNKYADEIIETTLGDLKSK